MACTDEGLGVADNGGSMVVWAAEDVVEAIGKVVPINVDGTVEPVIGVELLVAREGIMEGEEAHMLDM